MRPLLALLLLPGLLSACGDKDPGDDDTTTGSTGTTDLPVDADGDGFAESDDCDDTDATVFPGADEVCDGVDKARPEA
jgi:hypothetical protein